MCSLVDGNAFSFDEYIIFNDEQMKLLQYWQAAGGRLVL